MGAIVFANQKGGVGKSTLAVLFAHWLVDKHKLRVCVVDLDGQCNSSRTLRKHDCGITSLELFQASRVAVAGDGPEPLVLLGGTKKMSDVELAKPDAVIPPFKQQIVNLGRIFDAVVIDTPPSLGLRMSAALIAADYVACPIELEEYSIDGVTDMLKTIFGVKQRYNPDLKLLGIVANRFNPHSARQKASLQDLLENYSDFIIPAKISTRSAIPEALAAGIPVWRLAKSSAREASIEVLRTFDLLGQGMRDSLPLPEGVGA